MFLSPLFLIAVAVGAGIPLVLHLLYNQRKMQMPFPTLRFVRLAEQQSSRRIRLEGFLLWFIRTLIMALLGLAFAMPMLRNSRLGWLGNAPRDVAIVLDASYSMGYNTGRGTVWQKAIETATSILQDLSDKDRFCIYLAREQPEAIIAEPIANTKEGISRLKALQPGYGTSRLAPAVGAAMKALRNSDASREKEIHVISDNQNLPWRSFASETGTSQYNPDEAGSKLGMFVSLLGTEHPENTGVASVAVEPAVLYKDTRIKITATTLRTGAPSETAATLYIDGRQVGRRSLKTGNASESAVDFIVSQLPVGVHVGRIETPEDNLSIDNTFHFLIRVQEQKPVLVVGNSEDTLFLRTALRTGLNRPDALQVVVPEKVEEQPLANFCAVFLCNALPLSGQAIGAIEDYVKSGGLLVILPGMKASVEAYKPWVCLPAIPASIEAVPFTQSKHTLTWDKPQHPLVAPLRGGLAVPTLAVRRCFTWQKIHETTERLASMGSEPFLLERTFGNGRVLMFATSADRIWSDFPLSPFFLPLILQCADYGAGIGVGQPFTWATEALSLGEFFPGLKTAPTIQSPEKRSVSVRSAVVEGRKVLIAENLRDPGIYTMATAAEPELKPALAVNIPRTESDLTPIDPGEISKRIGIEKVHVATDLDSLRRLIKDYRMGRTYGEQLLWAALALIVVEFLYANILMHRAMRNRSRVAVDVTGHLSTSA